MTSTLHLGDFMDGGAINQGRINMGGGRADLESE